MPRVKSTLNIKYLTEEELTRLFQVITSPRDRAIFRLAWRRGLRAGEVALLQLQDYRADAGRLFIHRLKKGKRDTSGEYILTSLERSDLKAWLKIRGSEAGPIFTTRLGSGISQQMLDVLMKQYCAASRIQIEKSHFHALRHSCAVSMLEHGEDIALIKDHLGHANIASTDIYATITNKTRDSAAARLNRW